MGQQRAEEKRWMNSDAKSVSFGLSVSDAGAPEGVLSFCGSLELSLGLALFSGTDKGIL